MLPYSDREGYRFPETAYTESEVHFLVNLIANREVVKELVADTMTVEQVRSELNRILYDKEYRRQMLEGYEYMASCLGEAGAPKHAAREMVALLRRREE